jgi:hypothetical protein
MTAARAIVLLVAAACASAAQAGGETLREQVAATLGATTLCRKVGSQANPCPSGFDAISGVCCSASPWANSCESWGGGLTGTFTCGTQIVQCSDFTSLPACPTGTLPPSTLPTGSATQCPPQSSRSAAQSYCTSKNGLFSTLPTAFATCQIYSCTPYCAAGLAGTGGGSDACPGNVNMPAVLLAVVGTLVAAML